MSAGRRRTAEIGRARPTGADPAQVLGPARIHTTASSLRLGDAWAATLIITGYPSEVGMSWLEPLLSWPGRLDVAIHIDPLPTAAAVARLRRQRARLESARRIDADRGRLDDPLIEASAADAADLADLIARGESRLFEVGIYLTVHARTHADLIDALAEVRAGAASVMLDVQPATWRQLQGWCSTLPLAHDGLRMRRVMDTDALAAAFPLACPDLPGPLPGRSEPPGGILYGVNPASGGIIWWDRWACDNHNSVVLAHSGAGKSYLVKLEVLRNLYDQVQVAVIDPEDEYVRLAEAVGGAVVRLGAAGVRLNPFDLPAGERRADALTRRALFVHTLIAVLLGEQPPPAERAALDRAISTCYARAGISDDPATWTRPAPLMADLSASLTHLATSRSGQQGGRTGGRDGQTRGHDGQTGGHDDGHTGGPDGQIGGHDGHDGGRGGGHGGHDGRPDTPDGGHMTAAAATDGIAAAAATLAARLWPWVDGSFRDLFAGPSTVRASGHLVVWSTRHLPEELRAAGMLLALDAIWRDIDSPAVRSPGPAPDTRRSEGRLGNRAHRWDNRWGAGVPNPLAPSGRRRSAEGGAAVRRLVVVDEAWALMRESEGARFLARMAKSARKRRAGLAVVTQDSADLLASDLGRVVVANAATQILMRQAPQAIDEVAATFALTAGEARMLLSAERGHALLLAGRHRIGFQSVASATEHDLISTGLPSDHVAEPAPEDVDDDAFWGERP